MKRRGGGRGEGPGGGDRVGTRALRRFNFSARTTPGGTLLVALATVNESSARRRQSWYSPAIRRSLSSPAVFPSHARVFVISSARSGVAAVRTLARASRGAGGTASRASMTSVDASSRRRRRAVDADGLVLAAKDEAASFRGRDRARAVGPDPHRGRLPARRLPRVVVSSARRLAVLRETRVRVRGGGGDDALPGPAREARGGARATLGRLRAHTRPRAVRRGGAQEERARRARGRRGGGPLPQGDVTTLFARARARARCRRRRTGTSCSWTRAPPRGAARRSTRAPSPRHRPGHQDPPTRTMIPLAPRSGPATFRPPREGAAARPSQAGALVVSTSASYPRARRRAARCSRARSRSRPASRQRSSCGVRSSARREVAARARHHAAARVPRRAPRDRPARARARRRAKTARQTPKRAAARDATALGRRGARRRARTIADCPRAVPSARADGSPHHLARPRYYQESDPARQMSFLRAARSPRPSRAAAALDTPQGRADWSRLRPPHEGDDERRRHRRGGVGTRRREERKDPSRRRILRREEEEGGDPIVPARTAEDPEAGARAEEEDDARSDADANARPRTPLAGRRGGGRWRRFLPTSASGGRRGSDAARLRCARRQILPWRVVVAVPRRGEVRARRGRPLGARRSAPLDRGPRGGRRRRPGVGNETLDDLRRRTPPRRRRFVRTAARRRPGEAAARRHPRALGRVDGAPRRLAPSLGARAARTGARALARAAGGARPRRGDGPLRAAPGRGTPTRRCSSWTRRHRAAGAKKKAARTTTRTRRGARSGSRRTRSRTSVSGTNAPNGSNARATTKRRARVPRRRRRISRRRRGGPPPPAPGDALVVGGRRRVRPLEERFYGRTRGTPRRRRRRSPRARRGGMARLEEAGHREASRDAGVTPQTREGLREALGGVRGGEEDDDASERPSDERAR